MNVSTQEPLNAFHGIVLNVHTPMNAFKHHGIPLVTTSIQSIYFKCKLSCVIDAISGHVSHAINGKKN